MKNPSPSAGPLIASYTHHSPKPTTPGPYILGVDEAGRGPVLGPLVYGIAYCPVAWKEDLENLGFADSKTLTAEVREGLLRTLSSDPANLGWSVRVISPQAISNGMLRLPPVNLNKQSQDATILLIREVIDAGLNITEIYVDALGPSAQYQAYLESLFPGISITVTPKADSKFKIVGAASVAAKVTRDAWVEGWQFEEDDSETQAAEEVAAEITAAEWNKLLKPSKFAGNEMGSGYPSDPKTQVWLKKTLEPTFGFPGVVRFSWTTVKVLLEKDGHDVKWIDEGQAALIKAFESAQGREKDRNSVARDLSLRSVGTL